MPSTAMSCIIYIKMTPHILGFLLPEFHSHLPSCILAISTWMLKASKIQLSPRLLIISTLTLNILTHRQLISANDGSHLPSCPGPKPGLIFDPSPYSPVCPVRKAVCSTFNLTEESNSSSPPSPSSYQEVSLATLVINCFSSFQLTTCLPCFSR